MVICNIYLFSVNTNKNWSVNGKQNQSVTINIMIVNHFSRISKWMYNKLKKSILIPLLVLLKP